MTFRGNRRRIIGLRAWYRRVSPNYAAEVGEGDRFWQRKYYAFEIYEREKLEEKLQYVHENPVRAKLVSQATDWKWSSARWYESQRSVGVPIHWIEWRGVAPSITADCWTENNLLCSRTQVDRRRSTCATQRERAMDKLTQEWADSGVGEPTMEVHCFAFQLETEPADATDPAN